MKSPRFLVTTCLLMQGIILHAANENFYWPGHDIGRAVASAQSMDQGGSEFLLSNHILSTKFRCTDGNLCLVSLEDHIGKQSLSWNDPNVFTLHLKGSSLSSSNMRLTTKPKVVDLAPTPNHVNLASRAAGKSIVATFSDDATGITVHWAAILRDDSNYLRQQISITSTQSVEVTDVEMIHTNLPDAKLLGYTDGAPIGCGNWFLGLEHPMAKNAAPHTAGWTPAEMQSNQIKLGLTNLKPGPCTIQFVYQSGNHGITINQVSLVTAEGKTIAKDTHSGFSGTQARENSYTLLVPEGVHETTLIATLANKIDEYNGFGTITTTNGTLAAGHVTASLPRNFALTGDMTWTLSTAIGIAPAGQLRRAFAYYLQRERAHPYRQYWHYNSWYDLNINRNDLDDPIQRMNEAQCLDVIHAFDQNLYQKYHVGLNGFVWDDGWDDWNTLWGFHQGFPNGFSKLNDAARNQGAKMGAWLSPWGGYGRSHNMRVTFGKQHGYETNSGGLSLGGAKYRAVFRDTCLKMIRDYQQDYFKFDGIGVGAWSTGAPPAISADLDGLIAVTRDLRAANPSVFINCTVGTWASPYWTFFADSIWRQGEDTEFAGQGNPRERWINYKDGITHRRYASTSPMFPLNSLMYHGLVLGPVANPAKMPTPNQNFASFRHELQMMVGYGSGLEELYVTPSLMNDQAWALLAECIRFSRTHQRLLADSHWIGGNPEKNEIYGCAAWNPNDGGIITLRNPNDQPQAITLDLTNAWELPATITGDIKLRSPWTSDANQTELVCSVRKPTTITLQPFEVITLKSVH